MPQQPVALAVTPHPAKRHNVKQLAFGRQCVASGPGLNGGTAGVAAVLTVKCKDASGTPLITGGDVVLVSIAPRDLSGPAVDAHIIDNTDGSYTCTYMPITASTNCQLTVTVNGTHINGSPFFAQVAPGKVDPKMSEVFGRGLYEGVAGIDCSFTIQSKDAYGNRCFRPGVKLVVHLKPLQSLVPELDVYMRKCDCLAPITDNEDGSYKITYSVNFAGFYAIEVTLDSAPVGESPYKACIYNSSIAFPDHLTFTSLRASNSDTLPSRPAKDYTIVHDMVCILKSDPASVTGGRRQREYLYYYKVKQQIGEKWVCMTIRGQMDPPPLRRAIFAIDQTMVVAGHDDVEIDEATGEKTGGKLSSIRMLDLSDLSRVATWLPVKTEGKPPNAVEGYACSVWEGRKSAIISGGVDADGNYLTDVFMLSMGTLGAQATSYWKALAEWPASVFQGQGFSGRRNHSMTQRPRSATFWIFGGRSPDGTLLNDLHVFDMDEEQWSQPQSLNDLPIAREHHSSCFVADRYLLVYGGVDSEGQVLDQASVYDAATATWHTVNGIQARAEHKVMTHCGKLYIMGGKGKGNVNVAPTPLSSETYGFVQASCMDFLGNNQQFISIKPSLPISTLRTHFTLEAIIMPRHFASYAPIIARTDSSFRSGFGLVGLEHPAFKGDPEEGPMIHFFVGNWSPSGAGQVVHAKIEYDTWIHVAGVYNGSELKLYINGSFKDQFDFPATEEEMEGMQPKGDLAIGGLPQGKYAFDGYIDECRLWAAERLEEDIRMNMNTPMEHGTQHLIGQWTFNEGAGDVIVDSSGCRNHASFERYAGGVELRRVQSRRPHLAPDKSAREKLIDANFLKMQKWKKTFEERNGRPPTKADLMLAEPDIKALAQRTGEL